MRGRSWTAICGNFAGWSAFAASPPRFPRCRSKEMLFSRWPMICVRPSKRASLLDGAKLGSHSRDPAFSRSSKQLPKLGRRRETNGSLLEGWWALAPTKVGAASLGAIWNVRAVAKFSRCPSPRATPKGPSSIAPQIASWGLFLSGDTKSFQASSQLGVAAVSNRSGDRLPIGAPAMLRSLGASGAASLMGTEASTSIWRSFLRSDHAWLNRGGTP